MIAEAAGRVQGGEAGRESRGVNSKGAANYGEVRQRGERYYFGSVKRNSRGLRLE